MVLKILCSLPITYIKKTFFLPSVIHFEVILIEVVNFIAILQEFLLILFIYSHSSYPIYSDSLLSLFSVSSFSRLSSNSYRYFSLLSPTHSPPFIVILQIVVVLLVVAFFYFLLWSSSPIVVLALLLILILLVLWRPFPRYCLLFVW